MQFDITYCDVFQVQLWKNLDVFHRKDKQGDFGLEKCGAWQKHANSRCSFD